MKAAIYCRVSTLDQSLDVQKTRCVEYCNRENIEYTFFEEKTSGANQNRTELNELMQRVRQKEFGILLVYKIDRLGRSLKHLLQIVEELEANGVQFISLTEGVDTGTPQGKFFFQIAGSFAEFERALIRERTREKLRYLKEVEKKILGRPFGSKDKKQRRKSGYWARWSKRK